MERLGETCRTHPGFTGVPSGIQETSKNYGTSPCLMGKSTISMAIFIYFQ